VTETKRREICTVAAKLFAQKGFENISTRDISKAVGLSDAGMYYYFKSKEALLYEILHGILKTGLETVREIDQSTKSHEEKLIAFTKFYTHYYSPEIEVLKLLVEEQKKVAPQHRRKLSRVQREYLDIMVRILDGLKKEGKMAALDSTVCAFAFFAMVHWVYRWYKPNGTIPPERLSDIFNRIMTCGIRPR
jgi:TetR/AcrR family transcriptional regulator, cholesterol catabolism regulator